MNNTITAEQAAGNLENILQFANGNGLFKTFPELDGARMSVQVLRDEISNLKTLNDDNQKQIGELQTEIERLKKK